MKALVYTQPHRLELLDLPQPSLKPEEVLLRVRAVGVCGSDLDGFLGKSKKRVPPLVLGHEFSGEVLETGSNVSRFARGEAAAVYPLIGCAQCRYCATHRQTGYTVSIFTAPWPSMSRCRNPVCLECLQAFRM